MTPYFFKQMRKRTSLCLVVVLTALAFSLALPLFSTILACRLPGCQLSST